ncbi:MAG: carboxypeptidase regulatory-like domain-containing protein [Gemmatimonadetes bacterium]|nr:carboxypeptidase regulatory-like domain-containing protein [Gemmatimonadota bacterium]
MTRYTKVLRVAGLALLCLPARAIAEGPGERIVVRIRDAGGAPVPGANVLAMEGSANYLRQALVRADSNGVAVTEIGADAYLGLRVVAEGFETWKVALAPGSPDRRRKVIEVRLERRAKAPVIPIIY